MKIISLILVGFLATNFAWGQEDAPKHPSLPSSSQPLKSLKVGAQLVSYRYVEPGLIAHSGFLYGLSGEYNWFPTARVKGILLGDVFVGKINYDGALCDVNTNVCNDYAAKTNEFIFRLTHRFEVAVNETINVFAGPGLRYLFDKGDDPGFYTRMGTYLFAPLGFNLNIPFLASDKIFADFEYDFFIVGTMQSKLSEVNSTYQDITHKQYAGSGHKITLGYQQSSSSLNPLTVALFYENWNIAASNYEQLYVNGLVTNRAFVEPKNFSESLGLKALVTF